MIVRATSKPWKSRLATAAAVSLLLLSLSNSARAEEKIRALIQNLNTSDPAARLAILEELAQLGPKAQEATSVLTSVLNDKDSRLRTGALFALQKIGPEASRSLPAVIKLLADENNAVRKEVPYTVGAMKPKGKKLILAIAKYLEHSDSQVRLAAVHTLQEIGPSAKPAMPALMNAVKKGNFDIATIAWRVRVIDFAVSTAILLDRLTNDIDEEQRALAAHILSDNMLSDNISPSATQKALPTLIESLRDKSPLVRGHVVMTLGRIGPPAGNAVPMLTQLLQDQDAMVRKESVRTLIKIGSFPPETSHALISALQDVNAEVRTLATWALKKREMTNEDTLATIPLLVASLNVGQESAGAALATLVKIGPRAVPALIQALKENNPKTLVIVMMTLGAIGPAAKEALPYLSPKILNGLETKQEGGAFASIAIASTRARISPLETEKSLQVIADGLGHKEEEVRIFSIGMLILMGPAAKSTFPAIIEAIRDMDSDYYPALAGFIGGVRTEEAKYILQNLEEISQQKEQSTMKVK